MQRKRLTQIGLVVVSCALGMAVAYWIARTIQLRSGRAHLVSYGNRLVQFSDRIAAENAQAVAAVSHDDLPFCSDQELVFLRRYVFRSPHIRDLGRIKDGKLYCTTGAGRLDPPVDADPPDIVSSGVMLHKYVPLVFSDEILGVGAERDGVSIVFNPDLLKGLEEPPMHYSAMYFDQSHEHMLAIYGPEDALTIAEVLAARPIERYGVLYQPVCSPDKMKCAVAFESHRDILAGRQGVLRSALIYGALLGIALAVGVLQFHRGRQSMESQLRRALRRGSLTLVYQPIVDLATSEIVAAEALARWVDESGESVGPDIFVALAEDRGFAREITRLVVGCAAEELFDMLSSGSFRVSINIAPTDLADDDFIRHIDQCLATAGVKPSAIVLELTERSLADHDTGAAAIAKLKSQGFGVYIDDFGTGYSNLATLHRLDVDGIKVDRLFTHTVGTAAMTEAVVPQILEMAKQLNLAVVVEGIETEQQAEYFRRAGRGIMGQGWLFGRPVPAAQFRALVRPKD